MATAVHLPLSLLKPVRTRKSFDMAMNGVGCRATARIMGVGLNTILRR
ncbi:IS1-like element transposase [Shigella flexneri]